ncbi:MAG: hypothetical protein MUD14_11215 [Hydrococcus sp. Prado102]|jgi:hypothetical protein|nr:hypothetical protein [Hydrococcus sp. Prado102]
MFFRKDRLSKLHQYLYGSIFAIASTIATFTTQKVQATKLRSPINLGLLAILILVTVLVPTIYVSSEHYFYFWDFVNYPNQTSELVSVLRRSPLQAIWRFYTSLSLDYGQLPCLPLIPFFLIFGDSRLVFIVACALVYIVPFTLVTGAIATKLIPVYPRVVFWSTAFVALLTPSTWTALLRGYPDIGSAVLIGLAALIYLQDVRLKTWWKASLIGILLALSILFRRHFAYSVRAFLVAALLQTLLILIVDGCRYPEIIVRNIKRYSFLFGLIVISSLVTLTILGPKFVYKLLSVNFRELYASYEQPLSVTFQFYGQSYGWLTWLTVVVGYAAGILTRTLVRPGIFFVVSFGCISLIQWGLSSKQLGVHYTTHFILFVVLGIQAFLWMTWLLLRNKQRISILTAGVLLLVFNAAIALSPINLPSSLRPLLAANYPPLVRNDYDTFVQMLEYLREIAPKKEPIYVVASSMTINAHMVGQAETQFYGKKHRKLKVLDVPEIDSRDTYPLEGLLQTKYIVVAEPFQYHLPPQEQDIVKVAWDMFIQNREFSRDFQRLPKQFILDGDVTLSIYERTKATDFATALATLKEMQERIQPKPGSQSDWITMEQSGQGVLMGKNPDNTLEIKTSAPSSAKLLYFGSIPEVVNLTGQIAFRGDRCPTLALQLSALNSQGQVINSSSVILASNAPKNLSLFVEGQAAYLSLSINYGDPRSAELGRAYHIHSCPLKLLNLNVASAK